MPVLLASGIVCVSTARTRIRSAKRAIPSGVSNATPAGTAPNVGSLGNREWHGRQRCATTARTVAKVGRAPAMATGGGAALPFGAEKNTAAASAAPAGTRPQRADDPRPIIAWRAAAPATNSRSSTSQLTGLAYVAG